MQEEKTVDNLLSSIKKNWYMYLFIGGLIVSWTRFDSRMTAIEVENVLIRQQVSTLQTSYNDISKDIASIKTSIEFIKDKLTN